MCPYLWFSVVAGVGEEGGWAGGGRELSLWSLHAEAPLRDLQRVVLALCFHDDMLGLLTARSPLKSTPNERIKLLDRVHEGKLFTRRGCLIWADIRYCTLPIIRPCISPALPGSSWPILGLMWPREPVITYNYIAVAGPTYDRWLVSRAIPVWYRYSWGVTAYLRELDGSGISISKRPVDDVIVE